MLGAKGGGAAEYFWEHGRERFERELQADGVDADDIARFLTAIDHELAGAMLEDSLRRLSRRA